MGAGAYGVLLGAAWFVIYRFAPQPEGTTLWFTVFAVQLAWLARVCWRRTGLPYAAAAMALGSTASAILAVLAWEGRRADSFPVAWVILLALVGGAAALCFVIESRVHRAEWTAWQRYQEDKSLWDFLTGRHIPDLRRDGPEC